MAAGPRTPRIALPLGVAAVIVAIAQWPSPAIAQPATTAPAAATTDSLVSLNLPESAPLKVLIDYVSQEFGLNILYDDAIAGQRLTIKAPDKLPRSAVLPLFEGALRTKGLALIDAEVPGWKRIVALQAAAGPVGAPVVTQVFKLQFADALKVDTLVKPFLTQPGATSAALPEQGLVVVTDFAANLKRVADLVQSVDQPTQEAGIEFFPIKHADPARLTQQLDQFLKAKLRTQGGDDRLAGGVETAYDARTNQVAVIGSKARIADARDIIKSLDTPVPVEQSPIRFYKLANATAADVLTTIRGLEGDEEPAGGGTNASRSNSPARQGGSSGYTSGTRDARSSSTSPPGTTFGGNGGTSNAAGIGPSRLTTPDRPSPAAPSDTSPEPRRATDAPLLSASERDALRGRQARVTADPNTNSIIVVAPPEVQRQYELLIRTLDKRRPQVLIECTVVTLDTTNHFQFGVEIGNVGGFGNSQTINFSSFGLSTPNPTTGRLTLIPGLGFNGALVSSDVADVIVRALQQTTRARVSSAPRILVNDNNVGTLSSLTEFPYASVNASQTVATTSFGDYAQAGTEITVTPHISESDYLQLEYSVVLSSFTGQPVTQGGTTLPPPRKSDAVQSQVTIPDGSTIIVGGLNQRNVSHTKDAIPFLGDLPILQYLFSNRNDTDATTTLFVFIRPVILRDDKFADLKFLSEGDVRAAELPGDFPTSEPLLMR